MSHELRTPLNSLLILAEQLQDNPENTMTETQVEYASVILAAGQDLLGLLNSILDQAKAESGTVMVDIVDVPLTELRATLLREFDPIADGRNVGYAIDIGAGVPRTIATDPQRLGQILKNLLANAFKFTERGKVQLNITLAESGWNPALHSLADSPSVIAFSVVDTGIGIGAEQQQRIFEAFAQGDGTTARLYGGTGLGLSISRELAGLLGGEITVASTPGKGSTFTAYLPLGRATTTAHSRPAILAPGIRARDRRRPHQGMAHVGHRPERFRRAQHPGQSAVRGTKVLVVDDDYRNIFAMTALLERGYADVVAAQSGPEGIAALMSAPEISLVLMDIMMPEMDGYATIRAIRAIDQFKDVPIIAVTSKVVGGERERCLDAGANDYVPKPVDTAALVAAIGPWLPAKARLAS